MNLILDEHIHAEKNCPYRFSRFMCLATRLYDQLIRKKLEIFISSMNIADVGRNHVTYDTIKNGKIYFCFLKVFVNSIRKLWQILHERRGGCYFTKSYVI